MKIRSGESRRFQSRWSTANPGSTAAAVSPGTKRWLRALLVLCFGSVLARAWSVLPPSLTRGPYLQSTSTTGITVVFRTSSAATSTLRYGREAGPPWEFELSDASAITHVFRLSDLRPETRYSYEIASGGAVLAGGAGCSFRTAPPENSRAPLRFLAWGDSGDGSSLQLAVAARMQEVVPQPELALGLGDLVYDSGQAQNYDPRLFHPYAGLFAPDLLADDGEPRLRDAERSALLRRLLPADPDRRPRPSFRHGAVLLLRPRHGALHLRRQPELRLQPGERDVPLDLRRPG